MKLLITIVSLCLLQIATAQSDKVAKWTASVKQEGPNTYTLTLKATIDKGFYVYSQFLKSDNGPVKTMVRLDVDKNIKSVDSGKEDGRKKEGYDAIFEMDLIKFSEQLIITKRITTKSKLEKISGTIEFMTCNDEMCYPPAEVSFRAPIAN
jgi:thiol:disulfide interchange protein DsbD